MLDYGSHTGQFTTIQATNLPAGLVVTPEYNATNLTLVVAAALQAAGVPSSGSPPQSGISAAALDVILSAAVNRWAAVGLSDSDLAKMRGVQLLVEDLPGNALGAAEGNVIRLDSTAAGFGWFVDPTPNSDEEYEQLLAEDSLRAAPRTRADDEMDLLTVVLHELGHVLGLEHDDAVQTPQSLMSSTLPPGLRRLPRRI